MHLFHPVLYVLGVLPGTLWANFWDGFGSGPIAWCVLPLGYYWHHVCHEQGCYRWGHPNNGVVKCRKHL
jgi:hypothetical protein